SERKASGLTALPIPCCGGNSQPTRLSQGSTAAIPCSRRWNAPSARSPNARYGGPSIPRWTRTWPTAISLWAAPPLASGERAPRLALRNAEPHCSVIESTSAREERAARTGSDEQGHCPHLIFIHAGGGKT